MTLCYDQLTCQIRSPADQCHATISQAQVYSLSRSRVLLTADQVLVFDWIAGSCQVKYSCWKQSWVVRKSVNSNPGLKVNQVISVSSIEILLCIGFVVIELRIEGQTIYRKSHAAKLQNSNQNSTLSWVCLIGLQELRF